MARGTLAHILSMLNDVRLGRCSSWVSCLRVKIALLPVKPKINPKKTPAPRLDRNSRYHRRFAILAALEAERVLPLFENEHPKDGRPRRAIEVIRAWAQGRHELGMAEVRKLSLGAHAAARAAKSDAARFAARAAGHAVATWHVPTHAMGAPMYACKAILAARNQPIRKPRRQTEKNRKRTKGKLFEH
jgi:hypothetical protein